MLALLLATTTESLPRANAVKNVVLGIANLVAAAVFVIFGSVNWAAGVPLAVGLFDRRTDRPDHRAPLPRWSIAADYRDCRNRPGDLSGR